MSAVAAIAAVAGSAGADPAAIRQRGIEPGEVDSHSASTPVCTIRSRLGLIVRVDAAIGSVVPVATVSSLDDAGFGHVRLAEVICDHCPVAAISVGCVIVISRRVRIGIAGIGSLLQTARISRVAVFRRRSGQRNGRRSEPPAESDK